MPGSYRGRDRRVVGIVVGMAYVVRRHADRFEIRESVQTERGPRARTLANFAVLTDDVLRRAESRASRPFHVAAVRASADRRGVPTAPEVGNPHPDPPLPVRSTSSFVGASRRFARSVETSTNRGVDSGRALVDLIEFAEEVARHQRRGAIEPLGFPPLAQLVASRRVT
jgi:hypothetical protein